MTRAPRSERRDCFARRRDSADEIASLSLAMAAISFATVAAILLCLALGSSLVFATPSSQSFSFALMGDAPYSEEEAARVAEMLARIDREPLQFVVHIGDFKNGYSVCSDELMQSRFELFSQSRHPFIYPPGDNEWTDCWRWIDGGYEPVERLQKLREIFYPQDTRSLGRRKLALQRQSAEPRFAAYRENARWQINNVVFVTINVPGSNNNFGRSVANDAEYRERGSANQEWVKQAFELAGLPGIAGLAIFFQANPGFERVLTQKPANGYRDLLAQLARETRALKKPVLVGHGDTHNFHVDRPLRAPGSGIPIPNLLRVETFGSPFIDWVRIVVDPADPRLFRIRPGN